MSLHLTVDSITFVLTLRPGLQELVLPLGTAFESEEQATKQHRAIDTTMVDQEAGSDDGECVLASNIQFYYWLLCVVIE